MGVGGGLKFSYHQYGREAGGRDLLLVALEMSVLNPMIGLDFDSTSFYEVSTTSTHKLIKK